MKHLFDWTKQVAVAALLGLILATDLSAQTPVRLTTGGAAGSQPTEFAAFSGRLYFSATTNDEEFGSPTVIDGPEMYSTDGTLAGTSLFKNVNTIAGMGSDPREFTEYNGKLYFAATTGSSGRELWVSDGTGGGTTLVKDIYPGSDSGDPKELTTCNGRLYFVAQNGPQRELWVSDGTPAGTQRLSDALGIPTGGANPTELTCSGDKLFYRFSPRNDLWFTNGTAANTRFVRGGPLNPLNPDGPRLFISLGQLTAFGGKLIFRGNSPGTEDEPWVSDGTPEGTFTLDAKPGGLGSFPAEFCYYNGRVYFYASTLNGLWSTDGTVAGTTVVKTPLAIKGMTVFDGKLYFFSGNQLWVTNGTEAGTQFVKELYSGVGSIDPRELTVVGERLYFVTDGSAPSASLGGQLWVSDGTEAGTRAVTTINNPVSFVPGSFRKLVSFADQLFFTAATSFNGPELWQLAYTNMPPVAPAIANGSGTVGVPFFQTIPSFTDPEGFPLSYTVTGLPANLLFSGGAGGIVAGTPAVAGVFSVTVSATDQGSLTTNVVYTLTINPVGGVLELLAPTYTCGSGAITLNTIGGDGSPVVFFLIGVQRSSPTDVNGVVEAELRADPKPILIQATQNGTTVSYLFDLPNACGGSSGALQLVAPAYNCATGAITFAITGGDGSPVEFRAIGITDWTTNPNQFVDVQSRTADDVQPFTLEARQSGTVVSYNWNLKAACGRARQGVSEPTGTLAITVLGNPTDTETAEVVIDGVAGQSVQWFVSDALGRWIQQGHIEQALVREKCTLQLRPEPGIYLFQVNTSTQTRTVKILRH